MAQDQPQDHISKKRVLYTLPGMNDVTIRREIEYRRSGESALTLDVYSPPDADRRAPLPAVVFVIGFPDPGAANTWLHGQRDGLIRLVGAVGRRLRAGRDHLRQRGTGRRPRGVRLPAAARDVARDRCRAHSASGVAQAAGRWGCRS